jgi:predicted metal-dependent peptidase
MELKPDAIIYFTDGYGTFPDRAPRVPMIWVAVGRHTIQDSDFPFGDVVRIDR